MFPKNPPAGKPDFRIDIHAGFDGSTFDKLHDKFPA